MRIHNLIITTKYYIHKTSILLVYLLSLSLIIKAQIVTVTPVINNDYLINPGKGWVVYEDFGNANSLVWAKASVGYSRYSWAEIHIADSTYNWTPIDNALNDCISRGKLFAFSVMSCFVNSSTFYSSMPQWVIDAGAQYYMATWAPDCKVPVWNDPVFIEKIQQFVTALYLRYNGNPHIAYIDNGIYGNWGEWHLWGIGGNDPGDSIKNSFVDMYSIFDKTYIIQPNSGGEGSYNGGFAYYARDQYNMGWRENSSDYSPRWGTCSSSSEYAPNVAEWSASYAMLKVGAGWTGEYWYDQMVSGAVLGSHYSYQNLGQWNYSDANNFLSEKEYLIDEWQNKMGYWFKLTTASFPSDLANGTNGVISFRMKNDGVARQCVINSVGRVKLALMDNNYNVLQTVILSGVNPINWAPLDSTDEIASFSFPFTPGATRLALGVYTDSTLAFPNTKLGINNGTSDNWYVLTDMVSGNIEIETENINSSILIYPNPVTDIFKIDFGYDQKITDIEIHDIFGNFVFGQISISKTTPLNISGLSSGIYILKITSGDRISRQKFIKQ